MAFGVLRRWLGDQTTSITFTGGLGAQVLSAAAYLRLELDGHAPLADLEYFTTAPQVAMPVKGAVSIWPWQLDPFGITPAHFRGMTRGSRCRIIPDSPEKMDLGIRGLQTKEIRDKFPISDGVHDLLPNGFPDVFACAHARRGDYLNVASHVVSDDDFLQILERHVPDMRALIVVTDGALDMSTIDRLRARFEHLWIADRLTAWDCHRLLRQSAAMIGSNSQFSLVAALLHPTRRVFLPARWFGSAVDQVPMESTLTRLGGFRAL